MVMKKKERKSTKAPSNKKQSIISNDRRSALLRNNKGESQLELLQGVLSSSSSTASSLNELYISEIKQKKRPELERGESNTKLLLGFSSSETTGSSITDKSLVQDKNGIIAKAASLFPVQREVVCVKKIKTPEKHVEKKKKRRTRKLAPVTPPEFIFIPANPNISMTIIGETEIINI